MPLTLALRRRHRSQALLTRRPRGWWWNEDAADGATSDCGGVDDEAAGEPGWLDAVADSGDVVRAPPPVTAKPLASTSKYSTHRAGSERLGGCWLLDALQKGDNRNHSWVSLQAQELKLELT